MMFNNGYSGLLTKGLGTTPSGMITMKYHVFTGFSITVGRPGPGGFAAHHVASVPGVRAGSPYISPTATSRATVSANAGITPPPYYTPAPRKTAKPQHMITVNVNMKGKKYEKMFLVDQDIADIVVKTTKLFQATKNKVSVVVENLHSMFSKNDGE